MAKKDFFISYNHQDEGWAGLIAWQLEEAGRSDSGLAMVEKLLTGGATHE